MNAERDASCVVLRSITQPDSVTRSARHLILTPVRSSVMKVASLVPWLLNNALEANGWEDSDLTMAWMARNSSGGNSA